MATTDILDLNRTEMFAKIRQSLAVEKPIYTQNIMDIADDMFFMWNSSESTLLTTNWRSAQLFGFQNVSYQSLTLSISINFDVEKVVASKTCSSVALAGPRGVALVKLPARFGKNHQFLDGINEVMCRTTSLCGRFLHNNPHLEVRQVRWHPDSPSDSHLLVLVSDNTIRVYNADDLVFVWQVGPIPWTSNINPNASTLMALGESVVDFDFAPVVEFTSQTHPTNDETINKGEEIANLSASFFRSRLNDSLSKSWKAKHNRKLQKPGNYLEWPLVLLRENGNVYVMMTNFEKRRHRLQGPLTITPSAATNYGTESCSLIVMPSTPPTIIIAESNGRLHHALMIDLEEPEETFYEADESLLMDPVQSMLHIFETVELELILPKQADFKSNINCPIHLKRDIVSDIRYFAYHNAGFHAVTLYFLSELERFIESDVVNDLTPCSAPSSAEYILCTKVDPKKCQVNPVLGFAIHEMPSGLIALLASGQAISLKLVVNPKLLLHTAELAIGVSESFSKDKNPAITTSSEVTPSFVEDITNLLQRDISQPIISIDRNSKMSHAECLELLKQAIDVLREQYKRRHEQVLDAFAKKIMSIQVREKQQKCEIEFVGKQIEQIRDNAHKMAEKLEEINDEQEKINRRCLILLRDSKSRVSVDVIGEGNFVRNVEKYDLKVRAMKKALKACRETLNRQNYHLAKSRTMKDRKPFVLPEKHEKTIQEILMALGTEIQTEIAEIKAMNKLVGN